MIVYHKKIKNKSNAAIELSYSPYHSVKIKSYKQLKKVLHKYNAVICSDVVNDIPKQGDRLERVKSNFKEKSNVHVIDVEISSVLEKWIYGVFPTMKDVVKWAKKRFKSFIVGKSWSQIEKGTRNNSVRAHIYVIFDKPVSYDAFKEYLRSIADDDDFCIGLSSSGAELKRIRTHDEAVFEPNRLMFEHSNVKYKKYGKGVNKSKEIYKSNVKETKWKKVFKKKDKKKIRNTYIEDYAKKNKINIPTAKKMVEIMEFGGRIKSDTVLTKSNGELVKAGEANVGCRFYSMDGSTKGSMVKYDYETLIDFAHGMKSKYFIDDGLIVEDKVYETLMINVKIGGERVDEPLQKELKEVHKINLFENSVLLVKSNKEIKQLYKKAKKKNKKVIIVKKKWDKKKKKIRSNIYDINIDAYDVIIMTKQKYQTLVAFKDYKMLSKLKSKKIIAVGSLPVEMQYLGGQIDLNIDEIRAKLWSKKYYKKNWNKKKKATEIINNPVEVYKRAKKLGVISNDFFINVISKFDDFEKNYKKKKYRNFLKDYSFLEHSLRLKLSQYDFEMNKLSFEMSDENDDFSDLFNSVELTRKTIVYRKRLNNEFIVYCYNPIIKKPKYKTIICNKDEVPKKAIKYTKLDQKIGLWHINNKHLCKEYDMSKKTINIIKTINKYIFGYDIKEVERFNDSLYSSVKYLYIVNKFESKNHKLEEVLKIKKEERNYRNPKIKSLFPNSKSWRNFKSRYIKD